MNAGRFLIGVAVAVALAVALPAPAAAADPAGPVQWRDTATVTSTGGVWGRLLRLQNGDWLAVHTIWVSQIREIPPEQRMTQLQISRSTDGGRTWAPVSVVAEPGRRPDNGLLFQLPNGDVLLAGRSVIEGRSYRIQVWRSTDDGLTWGAGPLSVVDRNESPGGATNRGLWEPFLFLLPDGRLSVLYADETVPGKSQVISQRISPDLGATWGAKTTAVSHPTDSASRPGMPVLTRMSDGRRMLVFEVCGPGVTQCPIQHKISSDGATWASGLGTAIPAHACGPYLASLTDGRLFVTSCMNEVSYSGDFGASWTKVVPKPFDYPPSDAARWEPPSYFTWPAVYQTGPNEIAEIMNPPGFGAVKIRFGTLSTFFDAFEDGDDAGWTRYGGTYQLGGGVYRLANASGGTTGKSLAGSGGWTNGLVESDLTLASTGNAGVMTRVTNPGTGADAASGYYAFLDAGADLVGLGRQDGGWTPIRLVPTTVDTGREYRLALEARGSTLRVSVDGVPKIVATDSTFTRGQVGVRSHFADATYDDFVYTQSTAREDFADDDDSGWTRYGGSASLASGTYNLSNAGSTGKSEWSIAGRRADVDVEADVRIASGGGDAGILFRATDPGTGADALNGYYAALNDSGDAVVLGSMNGSWRGIASASLPVTTNAWHRLRVVATGPSIRVYVDDMATPKIDTVDPTWVRGFVGVRAHFTNASFDNLKLE